MAGTIDLSGIGRSLANIYSSQFVNTMQRTNLLVKIGMAERLDQEIQQINDKYDGTKEAALEAEVRKFYDEKDELATILARVDKAVKQMTEVKIDLLQLQDDISTGTAAVYDNNVFALNNEVGSAVLYPEKMLGNPGRGSNWLESTTVVDTGTVSTSVKREFLGTDYKITLDGGAGEFTPDFLSRQLLGPKTIAFDDITVNSYTAATGDIQITDGTDTYDGTITFGGVGVGSAWLYNDFAAQADKDTATADVQTALDSLAQIERDYKINQALLKSAIGRLQVLGDNKFDEYEKVASEQLDAKHEERRAASLRFDLAVNQLALTANVSATFLTSMFQENDIWKKRDVFDAVLNLNSQVNSMFVPMNQEEQDKL